MPATDNAFTIVSDISVPSPRLADRGALEHHVIVRDAAGRLYNLVIPQAAYTPEAVLARAAAEAQRREDAALRRAFGGSA